jgi:cytochrome c oxidase assembly factor CtaG
LGMRSERWHQFEQLTFLAAGVLFWRPVIQQWSATKRPQWSVPLYLFLATLPCDALSAFLVFCGHVVYRQYVTGHGPFRPSALEDQALAGALMWTTVTFAYLIPAVVVTTQLLSGEPRRAAELEVL